MLFSMASRTGASNENKAYYMHDVTQSSRARRIPTT